MSTKIGYREYQALLCANKPYLTTHYRDKINLQYTYIQHYRTGDGRFITGAAMHNRHGFMFRLLAPIR